MDHTPPKRRNWAFCDIGDLRADDGAINFLEIRRASNGKLLSLRTDKAESPSLETQKQLMAELGVR